VKKSKLIVLLASIGLILALVLPGCAAENGEGGGQTVVEVDKTYKCMNPQGEFIPVELHPLAPRLDSLDGKHIYYYQSEANPVIMPVLLEWLQRDYPTATWKIFETQGHGTYILDESELVGVDAVIRGIGW
jgi:hypothetical protein